MGEDKRLLFRYLKTNWSCRYDSLVVDDEGIVQGVDGMTRWSRYDEGCNPSHG